MAFVILGVGIIPAFSKTTESKSKSSTQDSECYHQILTPFLAQMLVAEVNVLEKALSAALNPRGRETRRELAAAWLAAAWLAAAWPACANASHSESGPHRLQFSR